MRGVKLVILFYTTNHCRNSDSDHSTNIRISTLASEKLAKTLSQLVRAPSADPLEEWVAAFDTKTNCIKNIDIAAAYLRRPFSTHDSDWDTKPQSTQQPSTDDPPPVPGSSPA
jgi:hypothetical protein